MVNSDIARAFACLMEDYLDIPSFVCEKIEQCILKDKCDEVIEFVVKRKKELKEKKELMGD